MGCVRWLINNDRVHEPCGRSLMGSMRNVFVVGTARSGTHLPCRTLVTFVNATDLRAGREGSALLSAVAIAPIAGARSLGRGRGRRYAVGPESLSSRFTKVYVVQTHPLFRRRASS